MVTGQAATLVSGRGYRIDITPPTVITGRMHFFGLKKRRQDVGRVRASGRTPFHHIQRYRREGVTPWQRYWS
ncbi:hypothetical protein OMP38_20290 [Cohnella ginsengisoli]|uniref:Uncharacterized protein n=2 Tax=Cohnella ginsengisoli TaxID=425004 RepID=A0A9X4KM68_9BACL|nr:hypothetical protein [Cohnella ginsengisoli]MDG0792947.1 hypothetical protein [Cohnella ginsengisoli]